MILVRWPADGKVCRSQILKSLTTCDEAFFLFYFKPISADDTCPLASGWESMSLPDS
jgi:hypothetical protein